MARMGAGNLKQTIGRKEVLKITKLSTAAWAAHNLGLSASLGGLLFGKVALNPSLGVIDSKPDRGKILNATGGRSRPVAPA